MKKILKTALIISIFALSCKANAAVLDSKYLKEQIKKDVEEQIKTKVKGNINVEITGLPYKQIEINEEKNVKVGIEAKINLKFFNPTTLVRVNVLVNGEIYKSFIAQAKISVYDKVWVATDYIKRGEAFTNVTLQEKEITYLPEKTAGSNFNPYKYISEKNYKPGDIIEPDFVENIPAIIRNNPVSVIFKTDTISVTIPAIALNDGKIGDYIRVRSKDYKKEYQGRIISENTVLVSI